MERVLLFVYGTLRRGGAGSALLSECHFLREAAVEGVMYDVDGRYPALVPGSGGRVHGEIWSCPAGVLAELDRYEGVEQGLFGRRPLLIDGQRCVAYVAGPALLPHLRAGREVAGGRWEER